MKSEKIILCLLLSSISIFNVKAFANNARIRQLENKVNDLSLKLQEQEVYLSHRFFNINDISMKGRIFFEYVGSNNKSDVPVGNAYIKENKNKLRLKKVKLAFLKPISNELGIFASILGTNRLYFDELFVTTQFNNNLYADFGLSYVPFSIGADCKTSKSETATHPLFVFLEKDGYFLQIKGIGLTMKYLTDDYGVYYGIYGNSEEKNATADNNSKHRVILAARGYYIPIKYSDDNFMHLGANYYYKDEKFKNDLSGWYNTNKDYAYTFKNANKIGLEAAYTYKNNRVLAEFMQVWFRPSATNIDKTFTANNFYIQIGRVLTGEVIEYKNGNYETYKIARPVDQGGIGGWSIAGRYSYTDAQDSRGGYEMDFGKYSEFSLDLNWKATKNIKNTLTVAHSTDKYHDDIMRQKNHGSKSKNKKIQLSTKFLF